ncbi:hypothetical protein TcWFU_002494 [Taenia crassiceps]|uniref:LisH domain-containing protein n=1 Tax=Taenia crassiceps TaxID=6207 RepID=A0ABR4Q0L3_9CEST
MVNNIFFSLLPSEICRLILGYLSDLGCIRTFNTFFEECPYLGELRNESRTGNKMTYRVGGFTLTEILRDYFTIANIANEKRDSIIRKWTNASLPTCHPGEVAPLLVCLLSDCHGIETASSSPQDIGHITAPIKTQALRPVIPVPSARSSQHITILRSGTSADSTQSRVNVIPSVKTLSSTPKVILKVVRTQSGTLSAQPSSNSSSSRRKIHSKPAHVTEISSSATASAVPSLNIQRVFCNLVENAKTVADRINSDLGNGTNSEATLSQLDFPIPTDIDQSSSSLLEQDMQDIINRLMSDVDNFGTKSVVKTGADTATVAHPLPSPSSSPSVAASATTSKRTTINSGVAPRGRIPVKPTSKPSFEPLPDEAVSPATAVAKPFTRTTSATSSSSSAITPSPFEPPPKQPRLTARRSIARTWAKIRHVPCEEYPPLSQHSSPLESLREDAICDSRESLSAPSSTHATTSDCANPTWKIKEYPCVLPPSTHIVDLDRSPTEDNRAPMTGAPLSAPPALSETVTTETGEVNWLPLVFATTAPKKENPASGDFSEFSATWVPQAIGTSDPPLPVVDLSNSVVESIPIDFITLRHADAYRASSQPASTRLSNSRLLDYINSEVGEMNRQHCESTPHTMRPHRRRRSAQSSSLPPPPSSPPASSISFSPSGAKENVAPGASGSLASASAPASAADTSAPRPKSKKKFDLSNLDVTGTLAKIH